VGKETTKDIRSKATAELTDHGLSVDCLHTKVMDEASPSKEILRTAGGGAFAAVAVGRTGRGKGRLKKTFVGSVSDVLFQNLQAASLWLA
jgi:hypothetical protein